MACLAKLQVTKHKGIDPISGAKHLTEQSSEGQKKYIQNNE
jgi:hypothetical protein